MLRCRVEAEAGSAEAPLKFTLPTHNLKVACCVLHAPMFIADHILTTQLSQALSAQWHKSLLCNSSLLRAELASS